MSVRMMVGAILPFGALALIGPCASVNPTPDSIVSGAQQGVQGAQDKEKCDKMAKAEIILSEERAVGGSLAVKWVAEGGGLALKPPVQDLEALKKASEVPLAKDAITEINKYLNRVGRIVAAQSSRPDLVWTFAVLDSPQLNAFSTPGGYVLVSRGLLASLDNEAELAGLLGHEIGHVVNRDAIRAYQDEKQNLCAAVFTKKTGQAVGSAANIQISNPLPSGPVGDELFNAFNTAVGGGGFLDLDHATGQLVGYITDGLAKKLSSGFQKEQEFAADQLGLELSIKAGYKNGEFQKLLRKLPPANGFLATHPDPKERAGKLDAWAKAATDGASFEGSEIHGATAVPKLPKEMKALKK